MAEVSKYQETKCLGEQKTISKIDFFILKINVKVLLIIYVVLWIYKKILLEKMLLKVYLWAKQPKYHGKHFSKVHLLHSKIIYDI